LSAAYAENAASLGITQLLGGLIQLDAAMFDRILPPDQWKRLRQRFAKAKPLAEIVGTPHAELQLSEEVAELFTAAKNQAAVFGEPVAGTRHVVLSMALNTEGPASEIFKQCGVDLSAMADKIQASELAPEVVRTRAALLKAMKKFESTVTVLSETPLTRDQDSYFTPFVSVLGGRRPPEAKLWASWPYLCIEVLTPEEKMSALQARVRFYSNSRTRYVWVLNSSMKTAYTAEAETGLCEVKGSAFRAENPTLELPLVEIFE